MKKPILLSSSFYKAAVYSMSEAHFNTPTGQYLSVEDARAIAQQRFDEWYRENIENAPRVYGYGGANWSLVSGIHETHTARLLDIQEIKKKCEKHEPVRNESLEGPDYWTCENCGCELVAEWKERKL